MEFSFFISNDKNLLNQSCQGCALTYYIYFF
jgi:hypothetical protein